MQDSKTRVRIWHITKFFRNAKLGRCRGTAEIEQAAPFQFGRSYRLAFIFLYEHDLRANASRLS